MSIRTLALRAYDALICLLPGTKSDPESFEARARRAVEHFNAEVDRATAIAQKRIDAVIVATTKLEARIEAEAREALAAAEALAETAARRAKRLKQLLDGE